MSHRSPPFVPCPGRPRRLALGLLALLMAGCTRPGGTGPGFLPSFGLELYTARASGGSSAPPTTLPSPPAGVGAGTSAPTAGATPSPVSHHHGSHGGAPDAPEAPDDPGLVLDVTDGGFSDPTTAERADTGTLGELAPAARSWHASDVFSYKIGLRALDGPDGLPPFLPLTLAQQPVPTTRATFSGLDPALTYEVTAEARGNAGATAADTVLNAAQPAVASVSLRAGEPDVHLAVPLDPTPFAVTLRLPSNADEPGRVPAWVTGLDVVLTRPAEGPTALVTTSYLPAASLTLRDLRGGVHYAIDFTVHSLTGTTTTSVPDAYIPREDGALPDQVLDVPDFVPPTGTLLSTHDLVGGAFGVAVDANDHLWVTNQTGNTVTELDNTGAAIGSPIAVGSNPRGVAVDRATGDVWVANLVGGSVSRLHGSAVINTYSAGSFVGGVAVDPAHRIWVTNALSGTARALAADGTAQSGSPYTVGTQPLNLAVNQTTGDVWVANSSSGTVSRITAAGVVSGPFATGAKPAGIAVAPDGTVWVVNSDAGTLSHLNADGTSAGTAITIGVGASGLAIDGTTGALWIGLTNGNRIGKRDNTGAAIGNYPAGTFPSNVAIDSHHHVWIVGNGKLTEIAP